jgi:antibiotic biosynthesis monooxygenase (ABM) superfamily enzyme
MIKRIWHGWTTPENAGAYFQVLTCEVIPGIEDKNLQGFLSIEVLRREHEEEVEFITIMSFESLDNIIALQGANYERCYVPEVARRVLKRWDHIAQHYENVEVRSYE